MKDKFRGRWKIIPSLNSGIELLEWTDLVPNERIEVGEEITYSKSSEKKYVLVKIFASTEKAMEFVESKKQEYRDQKKSMMNKLEAEVEWRKENPPIYISEDEEDWEPEEDEEKVDDENNN